jgi:hypothetical protein
MDTNQPASQPIYAPASAAPGMFGTKIPSVVAFGIGILLFFLPFAELKCSGTTIANKSGLNYALGKDWTTISSSMLDSKDTKSTAMSTDKMQKGYTQYFAMAALALAVLGLGLAFTNAKTGGSGGLVAGVLSAGALIALMINEKNNLKTSISNQAVDKAKDGADTLGFDKIGDSMNNIKPTLDFTPWFYVAVIAFLAAAFFCYKRMQAAKN